MSILTSTRVAFDKELRFIRVHINEKPYWEYVTRTNSAQGVTIVAVMEKLRKLQTQDCLIDLRVYAGLHFLRNAQRSADGPAS